tara:strand:+ start:6068 stop:6250 length:183 start_codon:yes stop_codon:yes gene_type:complete
MDTGDTAEIQDTSSEECQQEIISAAELAGETGGISCTTFGVYSPLLLVIPLTAMWLRRIK